MTLSLRPSTVAWRRAALLPVKHSGSVEARVGGEGNQLDGRAGGQRVLNGPHVGGHDGTLPGAARENYVGDPNIATQRGQSDILIVLAGQGKVRHLSQHGQWPGAEGKNDKGGQQGENGDEQAAPNDPFHFAFRQV